MLIVEPMLIAKSILIVDPILIIEPILMIESMSTLELILIKLYSLRIRIDLIIVITSIIQMKANLIPKKTS